MENTYIWYIPGTGHKEMTIAERISMINYIPGRIRLLFDSKLITDTQKDIIYFIYSGEKNASKFSAGMELKNIDGNKYVIKKRNINEFRRQVSSVYERIFNKPKTRTAEMVVELSGLLCEGDNR